MARLVWPHGITRNKNLEEISSDNNSKWLGLALESAKMCAYKWDLETNVIIRSHQSSIDSRIDSTCDSWMYRDGIKYVHQDDREFVKQKIKEAIDNHQDFNIEFRVVEKGKITWRQSKGHVVYGDHGRALHVLAVTQEITQRKEYELSLQNQKRELEITKRQLKITLEAAGMIALPERRPNTKFKSPEICRLFNIKDENTELARDLLISLVHPDDRQKIIDSSDEVISHGGPIDHEFRVPLSNGQVRWVMTKGAHIMDEQGGAGYLILQDITKRKNIEEQLKEKNKELEAARKKIEQTSGILNSIMASSLDNIYVKDHASRLVYCNPITLKRIGKTEEFLYGKNDVEFLGPGNGGEEILLTDERIMSTGIGETAEEWVTWRDGTRRLYMSEKVPQRDGNGNVVGLIGISRDITERKLMEEECKQKNHDLSQVNEKLERFSAIVAHDLKTPLTAISLSADLLKRAKSTNEITDKAEKIKAAASRMATLIDEVLQFAKTHHNTDFSKEKVSLNSLLEIVKDNLAVAIGDSHAQIKVGQKLPEVIGSPSQLLQLFQNLISNALKFRSARPPEVNISVQNQDDHYLMSIKDNGIGFDSSRGHKIFEPFERLQPEVEGNGLGLSICKRIIEQHGGQIWVESIVDVGTEFFFTLPRV